MLRKWEKLLDFMNTPEVRAYWEILCKKRWQYVYMKLECMKIGWLI